MTEGLKVAVGGAGPTYTPELVPGLDRLRDAVPVRTLALLDPDAERLDVVGGMVRRMLGAAGSAVETVLTGDPERALADADAVLIQLRVGGQRARLLDETLPLEFGCIGQETTGAGGAAKARRTVPVVPALADLARRVAKPDAWIIDFTNPVGIVTRALLDHGHRAIGLCNFAIGSQRWAARLLGVEPHRLHVEPVGLNHLSWIRRIVLDGEDVLPALLDERIDEVVAHAPFDPDLVRALRAIPSGYLRYYVEHDAVLAEQRATGPRAAAVMDIERTLLDRYRDPAVIERPVELEGRGGAYYSEAAVELLASLVTGDGALHVVNVRNDGLLPFLDPQDVVEVACRVDQTGPTPLPQAPVPDDMAGRIAAVTAYERLIGRAAVSGDPGLVRRALLAHPLIGQWDLAGRLTEATLTRGAAHLPRFAGR